jgi:two-component system, OmpR family, phosphate regulon response regulator PhoB
MNCSTTILLKTNNAGIFPGVREGCDSANVVSIDAAIPKYRVEGRLTCFLDSTVNLDESLQISKDLRDSPITSHCYILMALSPNTLDAWKSAVGAGADDFVVGPLSSDIIIKRITELKKSSPWLGVGPAMHVGDLKVDPIAYSVTFRNRFIKLSASELEMLVKLLRNRDKLMSRASLMELCRPVGQAILEKSFDISICRLRKSLKAQGVPDPLRRIRARGYVFDSGVFGAHDVPAAASF